MSAALVTEAARYLEAIDVFRSLGVDVEWQCEADEVRALRTRHVQLEAESGTCASPRLRINGRHVCLGAH